MATRETIELERERFGGPMAGSLLLHVCVIAAVALLAIFGHLHGVEWGDDRAPGAIQATLVSSAPTIPLPQEAPPTPNVLATEQPSPAPAPPQPQATPVPQPDAIPVPAKQPDKKNPEKKQAPPSPKHAQPQPLQNRAQYGEAPATQIPHSQAGNPGLNSPVNVSGGDFGSRFPWYVDVIRRKTAQNWLEREVAPGTPAGARVYVTFVISRDGSPSQIRIAQPSGSPTLDSSCLRAVQRTDTYGPLPPGYNGSTLSVSYYCEEPNP
ncbi:MAG TPA: TonB family protein [Silvibacterium sp.]|nr:TonB family protein [Silvibacterium sp.]